MKEREDKVYLAIDLKSFFASVECVERGLDPLSTHLVVADKSRTDKTICLAVSPSLKAFGIGGRARLFEVVQRIRQINNERQRKYGTLTNRSFFTTELSLHNDWAVDYIVATPHMARYIEYSKRIYKIYLRHVAEQDIHAYSIDEVFIDATPYLNTYKLTAHELAVRLVQEVLKETGITATVGIGSNLYLAKVAMDIVAKHLPADKDGVRIAELDEMDFRRLLWDHKPLTSFWHIGPGIARRLEHLGLYTMGDIARQSVRNEEILYKTFGKNAELLIDHAWGWESCTMQAIHAYRPAHCSVSNGQVLQRAYPFDQARVVAQEMAENLALRLFDKQLEADKVVLDVGYDRESLNLPNFYLLYNDAIVQDRYGRSVPKPAHGTQRIEAKCSFSQHLLKEAVTRVFDRVVNKHLLIRRITLTAGNVVAMGCSKKKKPKVVQLDLFTDYEALKREEQEEEMRRQKELKLQKAILHIRKKMGKNAILKGLNFAEGATAIERNSQIGGHKA